ncbi:nucleoid occlusion factor SlmA [Endozoicomonas numazuensis]|uniref:Nucleoid occlusion factor SlmA n=1 Tax=Endozoicomonas numazuensis TaxID=1137799 RepID=A0A081NGX1_9GAMM|nr:nucleoid occlusion factor SlmA [Endozoicomonas numazuensis]KEQ17694.1 TetR family transcriptional regulator [Endozoicomonas numazuensis]
MDKTRKVSRKDQILQALAHMLENAPGERITTSALAKEVGVSEAALYRHFPSKAKMFEGLIEFIEDTLFSRVNLILVEEQKALQRCGNILLLLLGFCEKNPGLTRILTGDALAGEPDRLRQRVAKLFDRLETQIKQVLRDAELNEGLRPQATLNTTANMLLSVAEGRICQYVRSEFKRKPTEQWPAQWEVLETVVFR